MRRSITKFALTLLIGILCNQLMAANYYFSQESGNDTRTAAQAQNPNTPWRSIEKLNAIFNTLQPGDVVYFKRGEVFTGTIHINKSGAAGRPITIGAYGSGAKPVITSLVSLDKWKPTGGGKFESVNGLALSEVRVLLINDKGQQLGRYPNSNTSNEGYITMEAASHNSVKGDKLTSSPNWKGGDIVIKKNQWIIDTEKITAHNGNSIVFNNTSTMYNPKKGYGFFIQNHLQTLDQFGEWYYDASKKKMNVFLGTQNPNSLKIQVSTLENLLTKTYGASHIKIENIHFKGSNGDAINIAGGKDFKLNSVDVEHAGENGVLSLSVVDLVIENSTVKDSNNNGLFLRYGNTGAVIKNNVVENSGLLPGRSRNGDSNAIGIFAVDNNTVITDNKVLNTGYSGIFFNGNNTVVKNNLVENFCLVKADGGGIYTYGGPSNPTYSGRKIIDNIIINAAGSRGGIPNNVVNGKPLAEGIFLDDNANGVEIARNTISKAANSGIKMSNVRKVVVKDNTIFDASFLITLGNNDLGADTREVTIENNILFSKYNDQYSYNINSHKNDIGQMGNFNGNYFFRPFGDVYSIFSTWNVSGSIMERIENLEKWNKSFNKDISSKHYTVDVEKFRINKVVGSNVFKNGSFNTSITGINFGRAQGSWVSNKISGGTLQVVGEKGSSAVINVGSLKADKKYLLAFKGEAKGKGAVRAYLRHSGSPWQTVSQSASFELTSSQSDFKAVMSPYEDIANTVLVLTTDDHSLTYWMDDLEFVEVDATLPDLDREIIFEYNAGRSAKSINLNGTYVDAKNKTYSGSVTIGPSQSILLVKTSKDVVTEKKVAAIQTPSSKGYYYNTTTTGTVTYQNEEFKSLASKYLLTTNSNVGTNKTASQDELFQKERFAEELKYSIPVENGTYIVKTYHHETYYGKSGRSERAGIRVFDIKLNGKTVKKDFDIFAENKNKETVLEFADVVVENGKLNVELLASANNATISGIAIISQKEESKKEQQETGKTVNDPVVEVKPVPTKGYYFNTTTTGTVTYKNEDFVGVESKYLLSGNSNVGTNRAASQDELFQKERFAAEINYSIPVENGTYTVRTYHHEAYYGKSGRSEKAGLRVFDIKINDKIVKKDFDIFVENKNRETVLEFAGVEVKNGKLNVELLASANNATIAAIAIIKQAEKESVVEAKPVPAAKGHFFNTTTSSTVSYQNNEFEALESKHLKSAGSNVGTNRAASQDELFQKERFAPELSYTIPMENGTYTVKTYHNETYYGKSGRSERAGLRVFDIKINGKTVKKNFDIFVENKNRETVLEFEGVVVKNGKLDVELLASANNATISGIAIIKSDGKKSANARIDSEIEREDLEKEPVTEKVTVEVASESAKLYPNPAQYQTTLEVGGEIKSILIHDMKGQLIQNLDPRMLRSDRGKYILPLSNMAQGLYLVSVVGEREVIAQLRLLVRP